MKHDSNDSNPAWLVFTIKIRLHLHKYWTMPLVLSLLFTLMTDNLSLSCKYCSYDNFLLITVCGFLAVVSSKARSCL